MLKRKEIREIVGLLNNTEKLIEAFQHNEIPANSYVSDKRVELVATAHRLGKLID